MTDVVDNGATAASEAVETITNGGESNAEAGIDQLNSENLDPASTQATSDGSAPESEAELREAVEDAVEAGASEEDVKDMIREFAIKVNGKEERVKLDLNDEEAVKRELQLARAGRAAMQDKAELEKMLTQELLKWKSDPESFFGEMGVDADEWAEKRLSRKVEDLQKSPEQLEQERLSKELEEARNKLKTQEKAAQEAKMTQLQQQASAQLEQEIIDALDKNTNLPRTRKTVGRIADAMMWAISNGYSDVTVKDVIPSVESEIRSEFNEFISELPEEVMEGYIGKKNLERLRKKRLAAMKKQPTVSDVKPVTKEPIAKEKESPFGEEKRTKSKNFFRGL